MSADDITIVTKSTAQVYENGTDVSAKGSLLSITELDTNFINLKQGLLNLEIDLNALDLGDLVSVSTSGANTGQVLTLQSDGTYAFADVSTVGTLNDLSDVASSSATTGQILVAQSDGTFAFENTQYFDGAYSSLTGAPTALSSFTNDSGYITDYTVTESDVTAHQAALSITESQISDLSHFDGAYSSLTGAPTALSSFTNDSGYITDYTVTESDVTAHQAALSITESQISDLSHFDGAYSSLTGAPTNVSSFTNDSGYITDYTVTESDVTAHQAALSITESQISDLQNYLTSETVTSLSIASNTLTYTDENGDTTDINLSLYLDDTNLARITSGSVASDGVATFTRDDATTFTVDFSTLFDDTNLARITSVSTASDGTVTFTRNDATSFTSDFSVFLDDTDTYVSSGSVSSDGDTLTLTLSNSSTVAIDVSTLNVDTDTTYTNVSEFTNDSGYITDYTVTESDVTAHQAALSITESQISDLSHFDGAYSSLTGAPTNVSSFTNDSGYITDYTVTESDVTAHQAALSITESQISDLQSYLTSVALNDISDVTTSGATTGQVLTKQSDGTFAFEDVTTVGADLQFDDNSKAVFGDGGDLEIYHTGTISKIADVGTGGLYILSDDFYLKNAAGTENQITATQNGNVKLFYDNSEKLKTTNTGIDVTGNITVSGTVDGVDLAQLKTDFDNLTDDDTYVSSGSVSSDGDTLTLTLSDSSTVDIDVSTLNTEETITSLSIASNTLTYTDENGDTTDINLSLYLDDTNLARITSGSVASDGVATFTRDDATTFTVDFSTLFDDTNLARITSVSTASDGTVTFTRNDATSFTSDFSIFLDDTDTYVSSGSVSSDGDTLTLTLSDSSTVAIDVSTLNVDTDTTYTNVSEFANDSGYITDYTVTESDVTAHQAALSITESQISDLSHFDGAYSSLTGAPTNVSSFTNDSGYITGYTVTESDVTAHEAALSITESQISDLQTYLTSVELNDLTDVSSSGAANGEVLMWNSTSSTWEPNTVTLGSQLNFDDLSDVSSSSATTGQVLTVASDGSYYFIDQTSGAYYIDVDNNRYVATSGQTTFNVSYTDDAVQVFRNGIKLDSSSYTATSGNNIVLNTAADADDVIEVIGYDTGTAITLDYITDLSVSDATTGQVLTKQSDNTYAFADTSYTVTESDVTAHQAALSITESQISDLGSYLTTVALNNISDVSTSGATTGQVLAKQSDGTFAFESTAGTDTYLSSGSVSSDGDTLTLTLSDSSTVDIDVSTLNVDTNTTYTNVSEFTNDSGYITGYTVTESDVTAHQAALSITESQISDLSHFDGAYSSLTGAPTNVSSFTNDSGYITGYTVTESDVTAHQAALSITESQISDLSHFDGAYSSLTGAPTNVSSFTNDSGYITGYTVTESDVTAHQAALSITESQISDLGSYLTTVALNDISDVTASGATTGQVLTAQSDGTFTFADATGGSGSSYTNSDVDTHLNSSSASSNEILKWNGSDYEWVTVDTLTGISTTGVYVTNYNYTASAAQTSFTGADNDGNSLSFTEGNILVFLNGVRLLETTDYTEDSDLAGITLTEATDVGDLVHINVISAPNAGDYNLNDLGDVSTSGATAGQVLTRQSDNTYAFADGSTVGTLSDLTDVSDSGATTGQVLTRQSDNTYAFETVQSAQDVYLVDGGSASSTYDSLVIDGGTV